MAIATRNPFTGETLRTFEPLSDGELEQKLERSVDAFRQHRNTSFAERARAMTRAAEILEQDQDRFARLITVEMGKPITAARQEIAKCALCCRYYAASAESALAAEAVRTSAKSSYAVYQPLGPVLAVMPWNFPFWQVIRFAAPALMAGNTGLLKHSSNVPQCALALEDLFREADFAEGVFQALLLSADRVKRVIEDERVRAVTLTGSEPAGRLVASQAGKCIKKTVLELGGSDPFIVMPSADLEAAAGTAVKARTVNAGQSCIAAKRFIVHDAIFDEFERRFVAAMQELRRGDPMDEQTEIGPLAMPSILDDLERQVGELVNGGARLLCGGKREGPFYVPTALANPPRFDEEIFGPVALLYRVQGMDEAIHVANETPFGLGSSVWTREESERERFIREIEAGQVFVNAMVASDPHLPFGGVKHSGYGRELGYHGIREFVNIKTVWIGA